MDSCMVCCCRCAATTGNYSRLACEIQFVRSMGYYLIQIYIPSGLIVIISWVSFWLNRNATPARVALGVTTVLTMTTLMSSTNAALPKISYVKSIDVYLGTCFVMVFASLLGKCASWIIGLCSMSGVGPDRSRMAACGAGTGLVGSMIKIAIFMRDLWKVTVDYCYVVDRLAC